MLSVTQLLVAFLLQLCQSDFKKLLFAETMCHLEDKEDVINFSTCCYILSNQSQQCFDFQEAQNRVIFQQFGTSYLDGEAVETLDHVGKTVLLGKSTYTSKSCLISMVYTGCMKARLKYPDQSLRKAFCSLNWRLPKIRRMSPRGSQGKRVWSFSRALGSRSFIFSSIMIII